MSAIFIIIFFLIYTSSGFVAGGKLFTTIFGLDYTVSLLITAGVVIFYTFLGGFLAVSWTDFIQGTMMFFAILLIPIAAAFTLNGPINTAHLIATEFPQGLSIWGPEADTYTLVIGIISSVAWGLGYFGQPHILVRFMAISDARELKKATNIAMVWVVISLIAAVMVGLVSKVFLSTPLAGADVEKVFLVMNEELFPPFVAGLVWSAVLAAIMSTASGQLLVTASSVSQDLYKNIVGHRTSDQELVLISRITVLVISAIALWLALDPNSYILTMVAYAWAGFGAAFGPAILLSLFWRRMTLKGCVAGIVVGGLTVLIWKQFEWFGIYEIVPGFLFSLIAIYVVSLLDNPPSKEITDEFDEAQRMHIEL